MRILIDITHPAQLNFYKNVIYFLSEENEVFVTYIDRGKLPKIVKDELCGIEDCNLIKIGTHRGNVLSIIFETNIIRPLLLLLKMMDIKPTIELSNGYQSAIYAKLFKKKSLHFNDDFQRNFLFKYLLVFFANEIYVPFFESNYSKVKKINSLKEWAYLSPKYFKPKKSILRKYNLRENSFIFAREVITTTINYLGQKSNLIESISHKLPAGMKVVLSLEDKSRKKYYPSNWLLLEEPIKNIHSLMYYSKVILSSGDSIAREGAILGKPSIYCGSRIMISNKVMIDKGMLFQLNIKEVPSFISKLIEGKLKIKKQTQFRSELLKEWQDINEFILEKIKKNKEK